MSKTALSISASGCVCVEYTHKEVVICESVVTYQCMSNMYLLLERAFAATQGLNRLYLSESPLCRPLLTEHVDCVSDLAYDIAKDRRPDEVASAELRNADLDKGLF